MKQLTDKQISDLLSIGFGLNTSEKTMQIERDVLFRILQKVFLIGSQKNIDK